MTNKILLSILCLLIVWNIKSQAVSVNDSVVKISKTSAQNILKTSDSFNVAKQVIVNYKKKDSLTTLQLRSKDALNNNLRSQIKEDTTKYNLCRQVNQIMSTQRATDNLNLTKEKNKKVFWEAGFFVAVTTLIIKLL